MTAPLCKECRHSGVIHDGRFTNTYLCRHPENVRTSLVDGTAQVISTPEVLRASTGPCGKDGIWFQPRPQRHFEYIGVPPPGSVGPSLWDRLTGSFFTGRGRS